VVSPEGMDINGEYVFKLKHKYKDIEISFEDLSSGEKILMALVASIYKSQSDGVFPDILLLDEIDATLHPSMIKNLLKVIENIFLAKGVKVIFTTHSPTTVALAPNDSIYVMKKDGLDRIQKTSKEKAIKILTEGIPTLSIKIENRKQIFVESEYDKIYYDNIYQTLSKKLNPEISISFIESGKSKIDKNGAPINTSNQVQQIVSTLRDNGNHLVFGIIDWDMGVDKGNKNAKNEGVKILGERKGYAIENFILNPISIAMLLAIDKQIDNIIKIDGIESIKIRDFPNYNLETLQKISNKIVEKILGNYKNDFVALEFLDKESINVSKDYMFMQGHKLEKDIKNKIPKLRKYNGEDKLKLEVINKVFEDYLEFIPKVFYNVFDEIQKKLKGKIMPPNTTEKHIQENIVELLKSLGFEYIPPNKIENFKEKRSDIKLTKILKSQLEKLNSFIYKGKRYKFTPNTIDRAIKDIDIFISGNFGEVNQKITEILWYGKSYEQFLDDGSKRSFSFKFIDFKDISNNHFAFTQEFIAENKRIDLSLFINGLPLVFIELKASNVKSREGISQMIRNQKENPNIFKFSQIPNCWKSQYPQICHHPNPHLNFTLSWRERI